MLISDKMIVITPAENLCKLVCNRVKGAAYKVMTGTRGVGTIAIDHSGD